jgi:hypothetical protein
MNNAPMTEAEFKERIAAERRNSRRAGVLFAKACAEGDVHAILAATDWVNETVDGWTYAMKLVGRLGNVSETTRNVFLSIWIETKFLPLMVGNRPVMAKALRVLMPGGYNGPALRLYRGTSAGERQRRLYGFSWTTRLEIARDKFGEHHRPAPDGAIVLETIAPPQAILLVREDEDYYDEGEVVVDPFRLGTVRVIERLSQISREEARSEEPAQDWPDDDDDNE